MPRLIAVHYRLLQGEDSALTGASSNETHDFGGELVLTFEDGTKEFISWVSEPVQYAIGRQAFSHNRPDADLYDHDVSQTPMWSGLVGREVALTYVQSDNQALQIASVDDHVLVCAYEFGSWWSDELTICRELPPAYDA